MRLKKLIKLTIIFFLFFCFNICNYVSANIDGGLDLSCESAVLINSSTGQVLYSKNKDEKMYPASTTKILTAILAIENCNLDDIVVASSTAVNSIPSGYSNAGIQIGEELTIEQLLEVFLVHSANEAGYILAEHISGNIENFSNLMNNKASEIGCKNTNFNNPSGIQNENHYSSAYDLALIAKYCMNNQTFRRIVSMPYCQISATNKYEERYFSNTNEMLNPDSKYYNENVIGIKTGFTSQAKNCLISGYKKDNVELISVVLGAPQADSNGTSGKYYDTKTLFDYAMNNFTNKSIASKGQIMYQIKVEHATPETENLDVILNNDINVFLNNSIDINSLNPEIKIKEDLSAPIAENEVIGSITYNIDGITYTSDLVSSHNVENSSFLGIIIKLFFAIILLVIVYELMYSDKKKKNKKKKSKGKYLYGRIKY